MADPMNANDGETLEPIELRPGARPLPGYALIERLGAGSFGEVWKAQGPGGFHVALKFIRLDDRIGELESRSLEIIRGIRHPNLLTPFGAWQRGSKLIVAMDLADGTLLDRLRAVQAEGLAGIPRDELLEYLAEAAKGIDYLNRHAPAHEGGEAFGIQHRDIKPQNILLVGGGVRVADFGLVRLMEHKVTGHSGSLTVAYAAPEFFGEETTEWSDQYSLAVTYCHLRGGRLPFTGGNEAIMAGHLFRAPDLTMLPEEERPALSRALAKEPQQRWPNCRAFVTAVRASLVAAELKPAPAVATLLLPNPQTPSTRERIEPSAEQRPTSSESLTDTWPSTTEVVPPSGRPDRRPLGPVIQTATVVVVLLLAVGLAVWTSGLLSPASAPAPAPAPPRPPEELPARQEAVAKSERGSAHFLAGDDAAATADFDAAIRLDPGYAPAYRGRGHVARNRGDFAAAIADYDTAIRLDSEEPSTYYHRGLARYRMGDDAGAIADFDTVIRLDPGYAAAYGSRGNAFERAGNHERAKADHERGQKRGQEPFLFNKKGS